MNTVKAEIADYRAVEALRIRLKGKRHKDIAAELGISESGARWALKRARERHLNDATRDIASLTFTLTESHKQALEYVLASMFIHPDRLELIKLYRDISSQLMVLISVTPDTGQPFDMERIHKRIRDFGGQELGPDAESELRDIVLSSNRDHEKAQRALAKANRPPARMGRPPKNRSGSPPGDPLDTPDGLPDVGTGHRVTDPGEPGGEWYGVG